MDDRVTALVHERTEGHPLFVVKLVDFAVRESIIRAEQDCDGTIVSWSVPNLAPDPGCHSPDYDAWQDFNSYTP